MSADLGTARKRAIAIVEAAGYVRDPQRLSFAALFGLVYIAIWEVIGKLAFLAVCRPVEFAKVIHRVDSDLNP